MGDVARPALHCRRLRMAPQTRGEDDDEDTARHARILTRYRKRGDDRRRKRNSTVRRIALERVPGTDVRVRRQVASLTRRCVRKCRAAVDQNPRSQQLRRSHGRERADFSLSARPRSHTASRLQPSKTTRNFGHAANGERVGSGSWLTKSIWDPTFSARREAGGWMRMKESYVEGVAAHNGPEFMRRRSRGRRRSVDRGNGGLGIEPRNVECPGRRRCREKRKATRRAPSWRGARRPCAVRDPMHAGTPSTRKPGGPWIAWRACAKPQRQGYGRNPLMHGPGKSDPPIVPGKRPNKPGRPGAEAVEGRGGAKGTAGRQSTGRNSEPGNRVTGAGLRTRSSKAEQE